MGQSARLANGCESATDRCSSDLVSATIEVTLSDHRCKTCEASDAYYLSGRVASTTKSRQTHWRCWCVYVTPLGVDPHLQGATFRQCIQSLTVFAAVVRKGYFNRGRNQVRATTASSALTSIGKACTLAHGINPTKCQYSEKFLPCLQEMLDGTRKVDPPTEKELPV